MPPSQFGARFPTTRWSWIATALQDGTPEAREALEGLCRAYWYPIYALIRRRGHSATDAADLAQDYFTRLIAGGPLQEADPGKGRFRSFLWADCGYFLANRRARDRALKRGGKARRFSLDSADAEGKFLLEPADDRDAARQFERDWALTLLRRALGHLGRLEAESGRGAAFERLKVLLTAPEKSPPYAEIAGQAGMSVDAVHAAAGRLRRRYRDLLRMLIADTLDEPSEAEIDEEIRSLFEALRR